MDENTPQPNEKDIKVLRTYTSDMADVIRDNEMSVIKIAMAEKEKREQDDIYKKAEGSNFSKIFLVIGGIIFIVAAIVGSYFLLKNKKEIPQTVISNTETFISYDSKSDIDVTNIVDMSDLLGLIKKEQQKDSKLINAVFLNQKTNNVSESLNSKDFLSLIKTTAPDALLRSLSDKYLLGKYSNPNAADSRDRSATFLIFETNNYSQAYASMLDWEKTMLKDLFTLFDIKISSSNDPIFEKQWKDIVINNKDARVLYGENGEGILYYVFVNKNDFVITDNIEALKEVVARLITKNAQPSQ